MKRITVLAAVFALAAATTIGTAAPSGAATRPAAPGPSGAPTGMDPIQTLTKGAPAPGLPVISINWSGYAVGGKTFNYVHSRFVQPAIVCPSAPNAYTSAWVGLDGFTNGTVEQDGTFAWCGGKNHTQPTYWAWYELFPAASILVYKVKAGDVLDATASFTGGKFNLTIADLTSGKSASHSAACANCQRTSAEWIVERPALCNNAGNNCFITPLVDFGSTTMSQDTAKADGSSTEKGINGFTNYPITLIQPLNKGFISLDGVSPVSNNAFTVVWQRTGSKVPITF